VKCRIVVFLCLTILYSLITTYVLKSHCAS